MKAGNFVQVRIARCLAALFTAIVMTIITLAVPSIAQAQQWQEYRRDDLGFRVELPATPTVDAGTMTEASGPVTETRVVATYGDVLFTVTHAQYSKGALKPDSLDPRFDKARRFIEKMLGAKVARMGRLTINGLPAREIAFTADDLNSLVRVVLVGDATIRIAAAGKPTVDGNPAVTRFLKSFALLRPK